MSRVRSMTALVIGALLVSACATPGALDPASAGSGLTTSPTPVAAANPTPVPTVVAAESPAVAETGAPDTDSVPFGAGTVVKTLADDGLRMRSKPSTDEDSYKFEPLLPLAAPLLILDGPVSGSGYEWYQVAPLTSRELPPGWVASASREGEPWIAPADFDCPERPADMRSLLSLPPGVGVHCFPNEQITVKARVMSCECDVDGGWYTPQWFSSGGGNILVEPERTTPPQDDRDQMDLSLDPDGEHPEHLPLGDVVDVTGVFDHPAAAACTLTEPDREPERTQDCRLKFAVTHLLVYGP